MNRKEYPDCEYLSRLALRAGRMMVVNFGMKGKLKEDGSLVTSADQAINRMVIKSISRDFPETSIISEEGSREIGGARYTVYCDPIDSTICFSSGIPLSSFCISVLKEERPLIALIYNPHSKQMWHAIRGQGTFFNGSKQVRVSKHASLAASTIAMICWNKAPYDLSRMDAEVLKRAKVRLAPAAIAYFAGSVASGNIEATVFAGKGVWEAPAKQLIIEEAGGRFTDLKGNRPDYSADFLCGHIGSNGLIHDELLALVADCL